ncbi:hypothetical protein P1J78_04955 [Psychromarinibacter sp. C21-152]|uniref:Uncharacterized protein n=1 Tax=Psychromarinibacter sediminicola TaxID=3033385 RepID=A0AAE3NR09_9RHOB|nr:hypothetical protein [Psychromarinibacter sediminicola]MDF0600074.1 hypothetical protein [Psychromarinibacter sediminicola]
MKRLSILAALAVCATAHATAADEFRPALEAYLEAELRDWVNDPVLVAAIKAQNAMTTDYAQDRIDSLDQSWRNEVGSADTGIVADVIENEVADFLRDRLEASAGAIVEIFAMDARGLNVAATAPTSDYWQGDEAKFQETFLNGPDAVHFGDIEFDESSQSYLGQISVVITDPDDNTPIGAITVGVDAEALL